MSELADRIEDHALEAVPASERKTWLALTWNTAGIVTTLVILFFGALVCYVAGVRVALTAGTMAFACGTSMGCLLAHVAVKTGQSNTLITRHYGLGNRGSAIASIIFGMLIIGMLALENALLYQGVQLFFDLEDTAATRAIVYAVLSVAWIALTAFGFSLVSRFSSLMLLSFLAVIAWVLVQIFAVSGVTLVESVTFPSRMPADVLAQMGIVSERDKFIFAFNILVGPAFALPLTAVDYARYARSTGHAAAAVAIGNFTQVVLVALLGGMIVFGAEAGLVQYYIETAGLSEAEAAARVLESPYSIASAFMLFGGSIGFILMFIAQSKAQVLNCYGASLALANLFDAVLRWRPGRFSFVVVANLIAVAMVYAHLLHWIEAWITMFGLILASLSCVIVMDYFVVKPLLQKADAGDYTEAFNFAGITSLLGAIAIAHLILPERFPIEAVSGLVLVAISYPPLRMLELRIKY